MLIRSFCPTRWILLSILSDDLAFRTPLRPFVSFVGIDAQFIPRLLDQPGHEAIVRTIIQMSHSLGLSAVAEGIEDSGTQERLRALGCDRDQGYHLGRPLPANEVAAWWRTGR